MLRFAAVVAAAVLVFSGVRPSSAADTRDVAFAAQPMDSWIVTVKGNAVAAPKWAGADEFGFLAYPSMSFRRVGEKARFSSPDDGIFIDGLSMGGLTLGPVFRIRGGRYDGQHRELAGVHDTRWTVQGGLAANYWFGSNIRVKAEIRRGFRGKDGFEASFGADFVQSFSSWTVALGPRLTLADGDFMRHNFGVTAQDALRNGHVAAFKPGAGVKSAGVYASVAYQWNEQWATTLHGGYDRLLGDAAKSPIVKTFGSPNQYVIGLTVAYSFPVKW